MFSQSLMYSTAADRRPSLVLNNVEDEEPVPSSQSNFKDPKNNVLKTLSVDDLDMVGLQTEFDTQMVLGYPMYLDARGDDEMVEPIAYPAASGFTKESDYSSSVPHFHKSKVNFSRGGTLLAAANPFIEIQKLRSKYIENSFQDAKSDIKNDIDNWLVYPKPLPKFWKFEKDRRFNEALTQISDKELSESTTGGSMSELNPQGYYYPHVADEEYVFGTYDKKYKYHYSGEFFDLNHYRKTYNKFCNVHNLKQLRSENKDLPSFHEFRNDFLRIAEVIQTSKLNEISARRLEYLLNKFDLFQHLKQKAEILENKQVPYRDFYNSRKVDRNLLLSGCIGQRQLSEFIWEKLIEEPDTIVYESSKGVQLKLHDIFNVPNFGATSEIGGFLAPGLKLIDDNFLDWYRNEYLPFYHILQLPAEKIEASLRGKYFTYYLLAKTFLEFDNYVDGVYLAELLIKYVIHPLEKSKYQLSQISVDFQFMDGGDDPSKNNWWIKFSSWLVKYKLVSYNVRWNVQIRRSYFHLFSLGKVSNFQGFLDLIFEPLFADASQTNMDLQFFLSKLCSIDLIIAHTDRYIWRQFPDITLPPNEWVAGGDNPTISQYMFYIYRSLARLNKLRHNENHNQFTLRCSCLPRILSNRTSQFGTQTLSFNEQIESLVCILLLCGGGLLQGEPIWDTAPSLTYLYYLFQIPIVVAPLSSVSPISIASENIEQNLTTLLDAILGIPEAQKKRDINAYRNIQYKEQTVYTGNPFMKLFKIGFKTCFSSDSVLFNSSYTLEPIIEEYSVAASIYSLNAADMCELARNSVLCSGYDGFYKAHWNGVVVKKPTGGPTMSECIGLVDTWYDKPEDTRIKHNVPRIRREYRNGAWKQEWHFIGEAFG